jgi:hypothetical protein
MPLLESLKLTNYEAWRVLLLRIIAKREPPILSHMSGSTRLSLHRGDARSSFHAMGKVGDGPRPRHDRSA